jgi:hypothetical protein
VKLSLMLYLPSSRPSFRVGRNLVMLLLIKAENQNSVLPLVSLKIGKNCKFFFLFLFVCLFNFIMACPLCQLCLRHARISLVLIFVIENVSTSSNANSMSFTHWFISQKSMGFLHVSTRFIVKVVWLVVVPHIW